MAIFAITFFALYFTKKEKKSVTDLLIPIKIEIPSNESFASAVNQYIFNNQAYIISLDIKKELNNKNKIFGGNYVK